MVYNTSNEHKRHALQSVIEHTYKSIDSEVNMRISALSIVSSDLEPFDKIVDRVRGLSISPEKQDQLLCLLREFHSIFSNRPGCNSLYTFKFDVIKVRPYPLPFAQRPSVLREINRMLEWGVIERSSSLYVSPIICVK